jgi:DNA/RNA-binding domain of Phe-tRNA-synthetase-like protein
MSSQERAAASMNPSGWLPGITDAALAHPKEYARGSIGTTEREGYPLSETSYLLPVGGYDLARIAGDIGLRYSDGGEPFIPIGGVEQEETDPGEIVYADDRRILTRRWNYRDCDHAKITGSSREIALFIEAPLPSVNTEDIQKQIELIASRVVTSCGGASTTGMLDVKEGSELVL